MGTFKISRVTPGFQYHFGADKPLIATKEKNFVVEGGRKIPKLIGDKELRKYRTLEGKKIAELKLYETITAIQVIPPEYSEIPDLF